MIRKSGNRFSEKIMLKQKARAGCRSNHNMGYIVPLYHPLRLAEEIAIVDQMLGGRLELGLVPGINADYFRPFGLDYAERKSPTLEFVGYLRGLSARSSRSRSTAKPSIPTPPNLRCRRCSGRIRRSG
jgi:hypothetical protein